MLFTKYRRFPLTSTSLLSPNSHSSDPSRSFTLMPASRSILARGLEGAGPTGAVLEGAPPLPTAMAPPITAVLHGRSRLPLMTLAPGGDGDVQQGDADAGGPGRQPVERTWRRRRRRPTRSVTARPRPRPGPAARSCRRGPWPSPPARPSWHPGSPVSPRRTGGGPPVAGSTSVRPHPMRRSWPQTLVDGHHAHQAVPGIGRELDAVPLVRPRCRTRRPRRDGTPWPAAG